ncbi:MAG TPA: hypothetical protein ENO17_05710 [Candidatus Atribacteria bacterium]|nr:hypothetical protein [Candidatus Atribacteria bacterium]
MAKKYQNIDINQEAPSVQNYFYLNNGKKLKNIAELMENLQYMDQGLFSFHVNEQHNDFAIWIRDVFGEKELARRISKARYPANMLKSIEKYIQR